LDVAAAAILQSDIRWENYAAQLADYTIITTDNHEKISPQKIASQIVEGFVSERSDGFTFQLDRKRAIRDIISMANPVIQS
jgi:UDP-N-acetylmuramyl tripeptide synthase